MFKYQIDDLAALPEAQRAFYDPYDLDGKQVYRLKVELPDNHSIEDVRGLKSALVRERENVSAAKREKTELEARLAGADTTALTAEIETLRTAHKQSEARLQEAVATNDMRDAVTKHRGNPHVLLPVLKTMTKVEGGRVVVLDAAGQPRDGMTVEQLVAELAGKDEYAGSFAGTGQSGGGTPPSDSRKGASRTLSLAGKRRSSMTPAEKVAAINSVGQDAYLQIPW